MRIAVPYENGRIYHSFGRAERFMIYEAEGEEVSVKTLVNTNGSGRGAMTDILKKIGADTLICGNLGDGAKEALNDAGIKFYAGVSGETDKAVDDFIRGKLTYNNDARCDNQERHSKRGDKNNNA